MHKARITHVMKRRSNESVQRTRPQDLPRLEDLFPANVDTLLTGEPVEECLLQGADLSGRQILSLVAWSSLFENVSLANSKIGKIRLRDVRLVKCNLSNAVLQGFEAARVEFIDCRMTGLRASECHWQDVLIENCDLRYAQLSGSDISRSEFRSCSLADADFRGANLEGAVFSNAMLHRADLSKARLRGTDLCGAEIEGIMIRPEDLRGALVSPAQAIDLVRLLGVIIK